MTDEYGVDNGDEGRESELPALKQLVAMGYTYRSRRDINAERDGTHEVILRQRLSDAIKRLNPGLLPDEVKEAVRQLQEADPADTLVDTNEKVRARLVGLSFGSLRPVTIKRQGKEGTEFIRVKIIDFDNIDNNDFVVTNQFKVAGQLGASGAMRAIIPDIVVFVNGLPLAVLECKSPTSPSPIEAACLNNLFRYQQESTGSERLFHYNHVLVALCGIDARAGTVGSCLDKYAPWLDAYPHTESALEKLNGRLRRQEIMLGALLSKRVLLDTLKNFVLYDSSSGKKAKILARQPQYRAVTRAIRRIRDETGEKGGVIWHTQGSGKSLSMLWLALLARQEFQNPPIIVVTDRRQLDRQITSVFKGYGLDVTHRARSMKDLVQLLERPRGQMIMAVLDKFEGAGERTRERAICLVDEAHRSQYRLKALEMRKAIPNGIFFAFTGTPLDRDSKSTYRVFGELLDQYGFKESQADGTTLPIHYTGRLARMFVDEAGDIDAMFERIFADLDEETKRRIRQRHVDRDAIIESTHRIKRIAEDIVGHYNEHVRPNGFKAMLVTSSRTAAVRYKKALDSIPGAPESKVIMSEADPGHADMAELAPHSMTQEQSEAAAERFKRPDDPTGILIVVDMLLVGYDVPICQTMYLDKSLRDHGLLQAIARVNRTHGEAKTHGLIVDYYGVMRALRKALAGFDQGDIGGALRPMSELFAVLRDAHGRAMAHLVGVDRSSYDEILGHFADDGKRDRLKHDFGRFARALNAVLPDPRADRYLEDMRFMARVLRLFAAYYDPPKEDIREYGPKVRELIEKHIKVSGIVPLLKDTPIQNEKFVEIVFSRFASIATRAALLTRRIRIIVDDIGSTDPEYADSLRARLERIIQQEKDRRVKSLDELAELYRDCVDPNSQIEEVFGKCGATPTEFSIYYALKALNDKETQVSLARKIFGSVRGETRIVDWREKNSVRRSMRAAIDEALTGAGLDDGAVDELSPEILERIYAHLGNAP